MLDQKAVIDIIHNGLMRNFGGLPTEINKIVKVFFDKLRSSQRPAMKVQQLIYDNINDYDARHLMLITSGDSVIGEIGSTLRQLNREYRIFYGSNFDEDRKEEYSYRMLSNIIYCMDHGIVLILNDLDEIYGSLYDMLNQNYTIVGKKRNCRIALGAHSNPMCHVHRKFRCIVLMEDISIDYSDPPFLNRFEKQRLRFEDVLDQKEKDIAEEIVEWATRFIQLESDTKSSFSIKDGFLGFHEETIPSLVKSVKYQNPSLSKSSIIEACKAELLLTCTPDAILRLSCSDLIQNKMEDIESIHQLYFDLPLNDGFKNALDYILRENDQSCLKFVCFTRSNIHTDVKSLLCSSIVQLENLGTFKSERQMTTQVDRFFSEETLQLLIMQCSLTSDLEHLLLTKLQVENRRNQYMVNKQHEKLPKHVCFLLHIDQRSFCMI